MSRNYTVQHHEKECGNCNFLDSIREKVDHESLTCRCKVKVFICQVGHKQIEKSGVCDLWEAKK